LSAAVDDVLDAFQSAWSGGARAGFARCCAVDVHYEDPFSNGPIEGIDRLVDHASRLWAAFPGARLERAGERLTDGRFVAAPCRLVARHTGDLPRMPATGRSVTIHAVLYCELEPDGERLWRVRAFFDPYDAGVQLGALPKHGTFGERALLMLRGFGLRSG
jgi:hypothetical protein